MNIKGGRALCNGIAFTSKTNNVIGVINQNGEIQLKVQKKMVARKYFSKKVDEKLSKIRFVRGLYFLLENKYMRIALIFSIMLSILFNTNFANENSNFNLFLVVIESIFSGVLLIVVIRYFIKHKHVRAFHGAEHKVANTIWSKRALNFSEVKKSSRVSEHCGTNLVVFWMLCQLILFPFNMNEIINFLIGFSIAYELFKIKDGHKKPIISLFYKIGAFIQEKIVTREPDDRQIELAISVVQALKNTEE